MKRALEILLGILVFGAGATTTTAQTLASRPMTFGTSAVSYLEIPAFEFLPLDSTFGYASSAGFSRYTPGCLGNCLAAPLHLPGGARVVSLELDAWDVDGSNYVSGGLYQCDKFTNACSGHPAAGAGPVDCLTPGSICSGAAFSGGTGSQSADLSPDGMDVDNQNDSYVLIAGGFGGANTAVGGMIVGYVLQVSPAPLTATFDDVPITDFGFQFVEAFAAAGITVGCTDTSYCPDRTVTRREMAIFFAKALGLQFP